MIACLRKETELAKRVMNNIRTWAAIGAESRLSEIKEEIATIHRAFPEFAPRRGATRKSRATNGNVLTTEPTSSNAAGPGRRRRRTMSAAARKRISDAQKARWAKQKAQSKN
jgi:hypothetical protein